MRGAGRERPRSERKKEAGERMKISREVRGGRGTPRPLKEGALRGRLSIIKPQHYKNAPILSPYFLKGAHGPASRAY